MSRRLQGHVGVASVRKTFGRGTATLSSLTAAGVGTETFTGTDTATLSSLTAAGVGTSWAPKNISGILSWHRADMGVTLVSSKISAWADQSGAGDTGRNATQGTDANRYTYNASNALYGNQATLDSNANTNALLTGVYSTTMSSLAMTAVVIGNTAFPPLNPQIFSQKSGDGTTGMNYGYGSGNLGGLGAGGNATLFACDPSTPSYMESYYNGTSGSKLYFNAKTAKVTGGNTGARGTLTGFTFGNSAGGGVLNGGSLAEIIMVLGEISAADRILLATYITARYGIAIGA